MIKDELGDRIKHNYESVTRTRLVSRMPVVIRLDGKAFHTFTRGFNKPFDDVLIKTMQDTMKYLCENVQGCVLGYTQSDEITLVLIDYKKLDSCGWFDNTVQKMCSVSASMATYIFNKSFKENYDSWFMEKLRTAGGTLDEQTMKLRDAYHKALCRGAMFDSRVFNVPKEEVLNCLLWRQNDASKNSVQMVARTYFSNKELHGKNCGQMQDMLMEKGINWNDFPIHQKRGSCCKRVIVDSGEAIRSKWIIDLDIPVFRGEGQSYINDLVFADVEK